jgi:hypothetical protein
MATILETAIDLNDAVDVDGLRPGAEEDEGKRRKRRKRRKLR